LKQKLNRTPSDGGNSVPLNGEEADKTYEIKGPVGKGGEKFANRDKY